MWVTSLCTQKLLLAIYFNDLKLSNKNRTNVKCLWQTQYIPVGVSHWEMSRWTSHCEVQRLIRNPVSYQINNNYINWYILIIIQNYLNFLNNYYLMKQNKKNVVFYWLISNDSFGTRDEQKSHTKTNAPDILFPKGRHLL